MGGIARRGRIDSIDVAKIAKRPAAPLPRRAAELAKMCGRGRQLVDPAKKHQPALCISIFLGSFGSAILYFSPIR